MIRPISKFLSTRRIVESFKYVLNLNIIEILDEEYKSIASGIYTIMICFVTKSSKINNGGFFLLYVYCIFIVHFFRCASENVGSSIIENIFV